MSQENQDKKVITRFPPSPTGFLHVGSARTALFNYIYAKQNGGEMLFRLEDTDKERSKPEFEEEIIESLEWLGIEFDKPKMFRQSERGDIYKKYLEKMIAEGSAYVSKETEVKEGGREEVIRFKNPNREVIFTDTVRGEIKFDTTELGDFVIAKSLDEPLYHLTVVVDDFETGVTNVIRGDDGLSNTPRQILIQEAIGAPRPIYTHLPMVLGTDKSKLSKRHGAVSIREYKEEYLPEAIINYLMLLGWNPGTEQEIFSMDEIASQFDLNKIQKGGAIFDIIKLDWVNQEYIKKMSPEVFDKKASKHYKLVAETGRFKLSGEDVSLNFKKISSIIKERIQKFTDIEDLAKEGEFDWLFEEPQYETEKLSWKEDNKETTKKYLADAIAIIDKVEDFQSDKIKDSLWDYATEQGRGSVLWPIRFALSGRDKSPDPFTLAEILGKETTIKRLNTAVEKLN